MVVIAICGSPGTGKTTIANYFKEYGFYVLNISQFIIDNELYIGYDAKRDSYIIDETLFLTRIKEFIANNSDKNIVIEGIGAEILPKDLIDYCIVLTCDIRVLKKRLESKGYNKRKIEENLEAEKFSEILIDAMENFGEKVLTFDTSKESPQDIFNRIMEKIKEID